MKTNIKAIITSALIPLFLALNACGGGSGIDVADGGITGTGITAGRITNFGSIIVNGVHFNVDNATFLRDGENSLESDFLIGEYVVIKGDINPSGASGIGDEVIFNDVLEGQITLASTDGVTLEVLGQKVSTDQLSVLHGFDNLIDFSVGNIVEVSGVRDSNGEIIASSIELKQTTFILGSSENEVKGVVSSVNQVQQTLQINNIVIDFSSAELDDFAGGIPVAGQFVEVNSNEQISGNILKAFKIELEDESLSIPNNAEVEIEGLITRFNSATDFDVNGLPVTSNSSTEYQDGVVSDLALNVLLEVEGAVNSSGTLVADEIKFKDLDNEAELEGSIQSIDLQSNEIVVLDKTVFIDISTLMRDNSDLEVSPLTINDLGIGDNVKLRGLTLTNGEIFATRLERED